MQPPAQGRVKAATLRIAFYAPMKPPDHPAPSGDRRMARLLIAALERAGHRVTLASRLRSWRAEPGAEELARLEDAAGHEADTLIERALGQPEDKRPALWFTYHLYYKAPDLIGPRVAEALSIPYLVAEASLAPKRASGPWGRGHRAVVEALARAAVVITLNPGDAACLPEAAKIRALAPFLDPAPFAAARAECAAQRQRLAAHHGLPPDEPWLLTVAMMRPGDKLASYRLLAEALRKTGERPWHLLIAGDGRAAGEVRAAFAWAGEGRVHFLGEKPPEALPGLYGAADLLVWPAVNEAYGMAVLEAQAAGLPVVAGRGPGVEALVAEGESGLLAEPGCVESFASALRELLDDETRRAAFGQAALRRVAERHDLERASRELDTICREATACPRPSL